MPFANLSHVWPESKQTNIFIINILRIAFLKLVLFNFAA